MRKKLIILCIFALITYKAKAQTQIYYKIDDNLKETYKTIYFLMDSLYDIKTTDNIYIIETNINIDGILGYYYYLADTHYIFIKRNINETEKIKVLIHEFAHLLQKQRNDLRFTIESGSFALYWKDRKIQFNQLKQCEYHSREWEKEAFEIEKKVYKIYKEYVKQHQRTSLPFNRRH